MHKNCIFYWQILASSYEVLLKTYKETPIFFLHRIIRYCFFIRNFQIPTNFQELAGPFAGPFVGIFAEPSLLCENICGTICGSSVSRVFILLENDYECIWKNVNNCHPRIKPPKSSSYMRSQKFYFSSRPNPNTRENLNSILFMLAIWP